MVPDFLAYSSADTDAVMTEGDANNASGPEVRASMDVVAVAGEKALSEGHEEEVASRYVFTEDRLYRSGGLLL